MIRIWTTPVALLMLADLELGDIELVWGIIPPRGDTKVSAS